MSKRRWKLIIPLALLGSCVGSCALFIGLSVVRDTVAQYRVRSEARAFASKASAAACVARVTAANEACKTSESGWSERNCLVDQLAFLHYCLKYAPDRGTFCAEYSAEEGEMTRAAAVEAQCMLSPDELAHDRLPEF